MNKLLSVLIAAAFTAISFTAVAADTAMSPAAKPAMTAEATAPKKANPQHAKMKNCNKEAKANALKGDERKAFMKSCLKKDA